MNNTEPTADVQQIIYALERAIVALEAQADELARARNYSAEFPAEDALRLRDAVRLLKVQPAGEPMGLVFEEATHGEDDVRGRYWVEKFSRHKPAVPWMQQNVQALYAHPAPQVPMTDKDILADKTLRYYFGLNGGNGPVSDKGLKIIRAVEAFHHIGVKP